MYYPHGWEAYHPQRFLEHVLQQLSEDGCPLCREKHPPQFHCFAGRSFKTEYNEGQTQEGVVTTQVPRIFCEINYHNRLETGELKQYTLTILPGFLIPYSTVAVDPVHQALESYISEGGLTQVGAAMRMGCLSPASFRLFYCRVRDRVHSWTDLLIQLVVTLGGNVREEAPKPTNRNELQARWGWFMLLSAEYMSVYARLPNTKVIAQRFVWQYMYAVFSRHNMGLGP
jgi:hypothetical protein